ncbi:DUF1684 domain-containing protein [Spirosoma luteolum]
MSIRILLTGALLLGIAILSYVTFFSPDSSTGANVDPAAYRADMLAKRAKKDETFRNGTDSPLTDKTGFTGLLYFAPDPAYRVEGRLEPFADKTQKLVVRMSDGSEEVYEKFAHAVFRLNGETCRLLVVKVEDTYSILFRDKTTGQDTYGGGRYIELNPTEFTDNRVILDFNTAYNPYCAYNPSFACPLPPAENTLPVAVRAGERYKPHD